MQSFVEWSVENYGRLISITKAKTRKNNKAMMGVNKLKLTLIEFAISKRC